MEASRLCPAVVPVNGRDGTPCSAAFVGLSEQMIMVMAREVLLATTRLHDGRLLS